MKKKSDKKNKFIEKFWDFYEIQGFIINSLVVILLCFIYHLGYLSLIRENVGNLIAYGVALLTLNGVFMTLLVTLKESKVFENLKKYFPVLHENLYEGLKKQVARSIYFIIINLLIGIIGIISNLYIAYTGLIIWSYLLSDITLGSLYNLRVVKKLVEANEYTRKSRI